MFASMRRYRMQPQQVGEFIRRVDESFADPIAAQPGFVSYELIDCGGGDLFTLSIFLQPSQAEASRELAIRWTENNLSDIAHERYDAVHGQSVVSRAAAGMLDPLRVGDTRKSVSIRLYRLGNGTVPELLKNVDQAFADHLLEMDGFEAAHLLDCGDNEVLWVSFLRDAGAIEQSDERLVRFFRDELACHTDPSGW